MTKRQDIAEIRKMVEAFRKSGMSMPEYARSQNLTRNQMGWYVQRVRKYERGCGAAREGSRPSFTRVAVLDAPVVTAPIVLKYGPLTIELQQNFRIDSLRKVMKATGLQLQS